MPDHETAPADPATLTVTPGGTYVLSGDAEFRDPSGRIVRPSGELALCGCGRSTTTPYCDGCCATGEGAP